MARTVTRPLSGWGNLPVETCHVLRPEKNRDLANIIASGTETSYLSRGLGRSYGDAALNRDAGVILHERLDRMLGFDAATGVLSAEAGVSFERIIDVFLPRGYFLPVTPGTKFVTLGGAIAADVHGKNHHRDGSIANFIVDFDLLLADGQIVRCSRDENAEVFWATLGGMGWTGSIARARMRLLPIPSAYIAVDRQRAKNLDEALELFTAGDQKYQYSVAWIDCLAGGETLGRSVLMRGNHATVDELPRMLANHPLEADRPSAKNVPFNFPGFALNSLSVKAFNARFYRKNEDGHFTVGFDEFFYPLDSILNWNRMYGKRGFIQYQAVLPMQSARKGLIELLEALSGSQRASFLAVLKTFGPESGGLLSFPRAGCTLALDLPNREGLPEIAATLDRIVMQHGGRVYLAKDAMLSRDLVSAMYPNLPRFREIKARIDPTNRFSSSLGRRLGIFEANSTEAGR